MGDPSFLRSEIDQVILFQELQYLGLTGDFPGDQTGLPRSEPEREYRADVEHHPDQFFLHRGEILRGHDAAQLVFAALFEHVQDVVVDKQMAFVDVEGQGLVDGGPLVAEIVLDPLGDEIAGEEHLLPAHPEGVQDEGFALVDQLPPLDGVVPAEYRQHPVVVQKEVKPLDDAVSGLAVAFEIGDIVSDGQQIAPVVAQAPFDRRIEDAPHLDRKGRIGRGDLHYLVQGLGDVVGYLVRIIRRLHGVDGDRRVQGTIMRLAFGEGIAVFG